LSAPAQYSAPSWRNDRDYQVVSSKSQINHRENVKRKLDEFQVDSTVHEMYDLGTDMTRLSESCRQRLSEQNGVLQNIASPADIDKIISRLQTMTESCRLLREVVVQAPHLMGADDRNAMAMSNGYGQHDSNGYSDEPKSAGLYQQPDTKKRRGRAAPPGRCHSCNRAETPEWRRGPDGARTLCNACGLHYAKLTRKIGSNNKAAAAISSSNLVSTRKVGNAAISPPQLRPKDMGPGGPSGPSLQQ